MTNQFTAKTDIAATFVDDKEFPAKVKMNFYPLSKLELPTLQVCQQFHPSTLSNVFFVCFVYFVVKILMNRVVSPE